MPEHEMYLSHYGLREEPFGDIVDLRLLYRSMSFEQTMASLVKGIARGHRYQALVGAPGSGKTIALHALMEHFRGTGNATVVFRTGRKFSKILDDHLGVGSQETATQLRGILLNILQAEASQKRLLILAIDDSHHLAPSALQELQSWEKLGNGAEVLRIVFGGEPDFTELLRSTALDRLGGQCALHQLESLTRRETSAYVHHRLRLCGFSGYSLFTEDALRVLAVHSGGVPGLINTLAFRCLSLGYLQGAKKLDTSIVERAIAEPKLEWPSAGVSTTETAGIDADRQGHAATVNHGTTPVVQRLTSWLATRGITWSGTAMELFVELGAAEGDAIAAGPEELCQALQASSQELAGYGIEVSLQEREGRPRFVIVRKTAGWSADRVETLQSQDPRGSVESVTVSRPSQGPILAANETRDTLSEGAAEIGSAVSPSEYFARHFPQEHAESREGLELFGTAIALLSELENKENHAIANGVSFNDSDWETLTRETIADIGSDQDDGGAHEHSRDLERFTSTEKGAEQRPVRQRKGLNHIADEPTDRAVAEERYEVKQNGSREYVPVHSQPEDDDKRDQEAEGTTGSDDTFDQLRSFYLTAEVEPQSDSRRRLVTIVLAILILGFLVVSAWRFSSLFSQNQEPVGSESSVTQSVLAAGYAGDDDIAGITKRAEAGEASAQLALSEMYERGVQVKQDALTAAKWLRRSAENGNPIAAHKLGNSFEQGSGVPLSRVDAYTWYVLASAKGNKPSEQAVRRLTPQLSQPEIAQVRLTLGRFYAEGIAVPRDYVTAYFWFSVAEAAGSRDAERERLKIVPKMAERQISEARARASRWLKTHAPLDRIPANTQARTGETSTVTNRSPAGGTPFNYTS